MYIPFSRVYKIINFVLFCVFSISCFICRAGGQTAWDMLNEERYSSLVTTSCVDLDNILGGGISCKEVTEIGE